MEDRNNDIKPLTITPIAYYCKTLMGNLFCSKMNVESRRGVIHSFLVSYSIKLAASAARGWAEKNRS
jgi:hypothetical protein